MVEFGNSLDPDKEFDVLHDILDFSLDDCLEEGEIAEDWDIGDAPCLGPIPSSILMELPMTFTEELDFASNAGASQQKQPPKQRKLARAQESGSFHTQDPVSVLESCESDNTITAQSKSKRLRYLDTNSELSTSKRTSNARRRKENRKKLCVAMDLMRNSPKNVDNSLNVSDPAYKLVKKCAHCQSSETTLWRDGPLGPKTLCNACGLQYRSGCLFPEYRPFSNPTFVPSQDSNSERKVAEMRNIAKRLKGEIKTDGAPEQTQLHVDNTSSHVSLLQNSRSYLKYRSKYINHAGVKPCVPTSSPCANTLGEKTSFEMHLVNNDKSLDGSDHVLLKNGTNPCPPLVKKKKKKKCAQCESTETPEWRRGPLGPSTLCNACGLQYRAGHLFPEYQPKASPTFVPSQHSNENRSLVKMRAKPINDSLTADIKIAGASEQKQLPKQRKLARVQESGSFHTQSLVLVLDSSESDDAIPARSRSKQHRDIGINPELSTSRQTSNARRSKESRKRLPVAMNLMRTSPKNIDNPLNVSDPASRPRPPLVKKCAHCQSSKTPLWRDGPLGPKTLCNACGLRYKSGSLFPDYRTLSNPAFVPSQHSNSLKKVAANQLKVEIKIDEVPEKMQLHAKPWVPPSPTCEKTSGEEISFELHLENDDKSLDSSDRALLQNASDPFPPLVKRCAHCESTKTPEWKRGPLGPGTLCNTCGLKYRAGHLVPEYRPIASPTFVPSQGSNDYRKCVKMRAKAMNDSLTADNKIDGAPEQKHFERMELAKHFETSTHVSFLESSPSYLKDRSQYLKHAGEEKSSEMHVKSKDTGLGAKPCVSQPSPCKKTSCEEKLFEVPIEYNNNNSDSALLQNAPDPCPADIKKCAHCKSTKTRGWRKGPLGPHTLCNACGLQYRAGRLVPAYRPKASPTFVPGLHSNCPPRLVKIGI